MKLWKKWSARSRALSNSLIGGAALFLLSIYRQFFSVMVTALFGDVCRFQPTCSVYAETAFRIHPPVKALGLTARRLCKCHPLGPFGFDPVPERKST